MGEGTTHEQPKAYLGAQKQNYVHIYLSNSNTYLVTFSV